MNKTCARRRCRPVAGEATLVTPIEVKSPGTLPLLVLVLTYTFAVRTGTGDEDPLAVRRAGDATARREGPTEQLWPGP